MYSRHLCAEQLVGELDTILRNDQFEVETPKVWTPNSIDKQEPIQLKGSQLSCLVSVPAWLY